MTLAPGAKLGPYELLSPIGAGGMGEVRKAPPTIIFHGTGDATVPIEQPERFCEMMKKQGNRCEVVAFEGRQHGFFNYGRGDNADYRETLREADEFLISLKYLKGKPTIK